MSRTSANPNRVRGRALSASSTPAGDPPAARDGPELASGMAQTGGHMARYSCYGFVLVVLVALSGSQATAQSAAAAAVKASPALVGALSKEMSSTPEQAAGAAGALFGVAKSRLNADQFSQVAAAVP